MPADRNRVQDYLKSQRGPEQGSVFDTALFVRDLVDPSTSDDDVRSYYDQQRAAGTPEHKIGLDVIGAGQKELARSYTQQRSDAAQRYTDATERSKAIADAETGVQQVARILGEMANAYAGGKPGEITATIRKYRDANRDRADEQARFGLSAELQGIEGERADARSANTLQASQNRADATADRADTRAGALADRADERARQQREATHTEGEANRANTLKAAGMRTGAGGVASPRERAAAQKSSEALTPGIRRMEQRIADLKRAKALYGKLSLTGPYVGSLGNVAPGADRQELDSILSRIRISDVPKGQGAVSNYERALYAAGVPGAESNAADRIYDKLIADGQQAIADDQARLGELETITGRPTPRGEAQPDQAQPPGASGQERYSVPGQGEITISPEERAEFLQEYPNAQRVR